MDVKHGIKVVSSLPMQESREVLCCLGVLEEEVHLLYIGLMFLMLIIC